MNNQSKKNAGRPSQAVKRGTPIGIRLTPSERYVILQKAEKASMNLTTYIRNMAIHGKVIARLNEEDRQILRNLIQMSGEISQVAKIASDAGVLKATMQYELLRSRIDNLIDQFNHDK